jgi:hypothetical protein
MHSGILELNPDYVTDLYSPNPGAHCRSLKACLPAFGSDYCPPISEGHIPVQRDPGVFSRI